MKRIILLKLILSFITINLHTQSPLITNEKQIKDSVKNDIVNKSTAVIQMKNDILNIKTSTGVLQNQINNVNNTLQNHIQTTSNTFNQVFGEIDNLSERVNNISTGAFSQYFVLKQENDTKDGNLTITGDLQVNGTFGVGAMGIWSAGSIYSLETIEAVNGFTSQTQIPFKINDKTSYLDYNKLYINGNIDITGQYLINGQPIQIGSGDNLGNHIATMTLNMNGNEIINSGNIIVNNNNPYNYYTMINEYGIYINHPSGENRAKLDLSGIYTHSIYFAEIEKKGRLSGDIDVECVAIGMCDFLGRHLNYRLGIANPYPQYTLDVNGSVKVGVENIQRVYICEGGNLNGVLTININICTDNNGTANETALYIGQ